MPQLFEAALPMEEALAVHDAWVRVHSDLYKHACMVAVLTVFV